MFRQRLATAFVLALSLLLIGRPTPANAQETTGTIKGRLTDQQARPIPGVNVSIIGSQGVKKTTTDFDGRFSVPFLASGTYTIRAEISRFRPIEQRGVEVTLGATLNFPLTMELATVSETVRVTTGTPVVDTTSTTIGAVIRGDFATSVPVGRRVSDVTYMAPGVSSSGSAGRANPSIAGGSGLDNQYVVDGVNITNTGYGALGSYSIVFGSLGNATPFDFVKDVQVKTGGYEAEYGQATGGVVNVTTKSGSNDFQGSFFGYTQLSGLQGSYKQYQSDNGTVQLISTQSSDGGVEAGGAIIKNRMFFFGAIDPQWEQRVSHAPAGFPLESLGDVSRNRRSTTYSTKLTMQLTDHQRIDVSFFGDPSTGDNGPQRSSALTVTDTKSFSAISYGGHNQTARYYGAIGNKWLIEAAYAHALNRISEVPSDNSTRVTDLTVTPNVIAGGIGFYEKGNRSVNDQYTFRSTHLKNSHEIKYGVDYNNVVYSQINQRTGPTFFTSDGRETATGGSVSIVPDINFGQIYRVTRANYNSERTTRQHYLSLFVQDEWRAGRRLTIHPGLRYEQETLVGTIINNFTLKNNWAPRIGVSYDATGNGRTKLFGSYGRFYARVPNDLAARALSADDGLSRADYFDLGLTKPIPNGVATQQDASSGVITNHLLLAGTGADTIDPNAKLSYVNEYLIGMEREVMRNMSLGIRYIHRDIGRVLEDVANVPMVAYDLGVPGVSSVEYILTNPTTKTPIFPAAAFLGASFDNPIHVYNAVELTFNRRLSHQWSLMTSYRWSRLRGNFEGFYRDDNGQSDPGITSLYDFPTNDPSYTAIGTPQFGYGGDIRYLGQSGPLPLDRPHQVKMYSTYVLNNGLQFGFTVNLSSGKPLTPLAANPNYTNGGEIPTAPRGSGIMTVDGFKTRTPFESQVDVQASYTIHPDKARQVAIVLQVFNVFNQRRVTDYDAWTELEFGVPNPDFGKPISQISANPQYQAPITARLGVRIKF
jgi:hypothetical protein